MYSQLEQTSNLVESVFDILDDMDFEATKDKEILEKLYAYCARIDNDRFKLLSFVKNIMDEYGEEHRHPLITKLFDLFQREYHVLMDSPLKLKVKVQIDSLSENSMVKDECIHLILHQYRQQGINAYLIAAEKTPPQIIGSSIFTVVSQKKLMPILQNIASEIGLCIRNDEMTNPRIQMIVRQQEHYCVLDFDKISGQCFVLDAAGDSRQNNLIDVLQSMPEISSVVYVNNFTYEYNGASKTTTLQKDYYSCAVFALDHVQVCAQHNYLHDVLNQYATVESEKLKSISWFDLPAPFVRNAQSPTFKEVYCQKTGDESAKDHFGIHDFKKTVNYLKLNAVGFLSHLDEIKCQEIIESPKTSITSDISDKFSRIN